MKDHPLICKGPVVRNLLDGRQTQDRRPLKKQPVWRINPPSALTDIEGGFVDDLGVGHPIRFAVGDRIWVRETARYIWHKKQWRYDLDGTVLPVQLETPTPTRWPRGVCPSIHLPEKQSRLTLVITDVRVERLQDISRDDARAEGITIGEPIPHLVPGSYGRVYHDGATDPIDGWTRDPIEAFSRLWDFMYAATPHHWHANPWVVATTFTVHKCNIQDMAVAA